MKPWAQLVAVASAGVVAGAIAGWYLHRPEAQVVDKLDDHEKHDEKKDEQQTTQTGPRVIERVVTRVVPGPAGPERVVERTREVQGPTTTVYRAREDSTATRDVQREISVTPAPRPSWAVFGGLQLYPEKLPVAGVGYRLVGPIWLEAWARPRLELALPAAGVQLRLEF